MILKQIKLKGFTLVELLVVVAILGVLAAVGIVAYTGYLAKAKKNVVKSRHHEIVSFIRAEFMACTMGVRDHIRTINTKGEEVRDSCSAPENDDGGAGNAQNAFSAFVNHFNNIYDGIHPEGWRGTPIVECTEAVSGKTPDSLLTDICWKMFKSRSDNKNITKWCGEDWGPGIVVVTSVDEFDRREEENHLPYYGNNQMRLVTCIEQEFSVHNSWNN